MQLSGTLSLANIDNTVSYKFLKKFFQSNGEFDVISAKIVNEAYVSTLLGIQQVYQDVGFTGYSLGRSTWKLH